MSKTKLTRANAAELAAKYKNIISNEADRKALMAPEERHSVLSDKKVNLPEKQLQRLIEFEMRKDELRKKSLNWESTLINVVSGR